MSKPGIYTVSHNHSACLKSAHIRSHPVRFNLRHLNCRPLLRPARKMSTSTQINQKDLDSFRQHLSQSNRIVALLGAGLSASSGLPTFRGAGGLWRTHDATSIATPEAFEADPAFVWQFYSYRRHMALNAKPNPAHMALVALSEKKPNFLTLSQNVDGLSPRANHPPSQLKLLHGNLFDVKCWNAPRCDYVRKNDFTDPIVPSLAIPESTIQAEKALQTGQHDKQDSSNQVGSQSTSLIRGQDISSIDVPLPEITTSSLPHCPKCKKLLRPGVVWFGEALPSQTMSEVNDYFSESEPIDLMLVIGTSAKVYPAAGYTQLARSKGARVAVINMDSGDKGQLGKQDWFFEGDAAQILPELFKHEIGDVKAFEE